MTDPRLTDSSVFPDPVYKETVLRPLFDGAKAHHVEGFRAIDRAHLVMLVETGILDAARRPPRSPGRLQAIDAEVDPATLIYTGEVEDFFFLIEKELKARLGPDLAGRLHTARSRNDIDHTLFKLGLKSRIDVLLGKAVALLDALVAAAEREKTTLIVAYTHGQPAQPTTFGHYLAAIIEVLVRDIERLFEAREIVDLSPMGAAAITTSGFPIDRARVAQLLGFAAPLQNSYSCIAAVDYITSTYGAIELMFLHLGRPIQDLQFWTSFEVGQVYVPNAFVQISSIMPQKRNPVPIEHLRHLASQTFGRARAMLDVMHNTPFTDMNDSEGESQAMGYQAFDSAYRVLDLLAALVAQIRIDPARVANNIRRSCITITELADSLVRREGLSFREGARDRRRGGAAPWWPCDGDLPVDGYAPFLAAFEKATGRKPAIDAALFAELVSPEHFVAVRDRFGGPAPAPLMRRDCRLSRKVGRFLPRRMKRHADAEAAAAERTPNAVFRTDGSRLMAEIELQRPGQDLWQDHGGAWHRPRDRRWRIRRARRPFRLRQVDDAAHDRGAGGHLRRHAPDRRRGGQRARAQAAQYRHGVPELRHLSASERGAEYRLRALYRQAEQGREGPAHPRPRRKSWASKTCWSAGRPNSPAASASASPSAAPWCAIPWRSCSTSRCPISTRSCARRCASRSSGCTSGWAPPSSMSPMTRSKP